MPVPQSAQSIRESLAHNDALDELEREGKYSHLLSVAEANHPTYGLFFLGRGDEKNRTYFDYQEVVAQDLEPLADTRRRSHRAALPARTDAAPGGSLSSQSVARNGTRLARITPFREERENPLHPYIDNEDWPARAGLSHKGPLIEIWSLEKP